jgi:hypothetical protein
VGEGWILEESEVSHAILVRDDWLCGRNRGHFEMEMRLPYFMDRSQHGVSELMISLRD